MAVYIVTAKLGGGKNLVAMMRMRWYLSRGLPVYTNIDVDLRRLCKTEEAARAARVVRLPDFPSSQDLHDLGMIDNEGDETKNAGLFLDECGVLFNSREWGDKDRKEIVDWMLHSRKLGFDVYLIVQNIGLLDKQLRIALAELVVYVRRMDRVAVPIIGGVVRWCTLGFVRLKLPRIHMAAVKYGEGPSAMDSDSWIFRGNDLFGCYPTKQLFSKKYPHGSYCVIPNDNALRPHFWPLYREGVVDGRTVWIKRAEAEPQAAPAAPAAAGGKRPDVAALMAACSCPDERWEACRALGWS